ncbi:hypothetical protein LshimejAT787_1301390 [Lyophyllum shimeji]|uniref:Uncharacterized protein n=1 Tax=Lyophyllum shimeji TaxID=47721 RepID=A0A9P3US26_LYOSH|nr:hypothetical protein LshimejAT787_1301390 [Lyophyllum shimeji]
MTAVYTLCTATYPTIVVILVITQRSITDISGFIAIIPKKTSLDIRNAGACTVTAGTSRLPAPRPLPERRSPPSRFFRRNLRASFQSRLMSSPRRAER